MFHQQPQLSNELLPQPFVLDVAGEVNPTTQKETALGQTESNRPNTTAFTSYTTELLEEQL